MSGVLTHRQFRALGYAFVLPIVPPGAPLSPRSTLTKDPGKAGKVPGVRNRDGLWHSFDWINAPPALDVTLDWWTEIGAGVGLRLGLQPDGDTLVAADADTMDAVKAALIGDAVRAVISAGVPTRIGAAPRALYLLRVSGPFPYARLEFQSDSAEERFEILSGGKQCVVQGIHPRTGQPYRWTTELVPYADLPRVAPETLLGVLEHLRAPLGARPIKTENAKDAPRQESLRGPIDHVRSAMRALGNRDSRFPTRESFLEIGYSLKAALPDDPDEALALFQEWAQLWDGGSNDPEYVEGEWRRMKPPFRRGASWLFEEAEEHGDGSFNRAQIHFEEPAAAEEPLFGEDRGSETASAARFVFETFDQAADSALSDGAPYLVKGILDLGAMSVVYGDSNVGKTFVVMQIEHCIATGRPYAGRKVRRGAVLHLFTEGARGGRKRAAALRRSVGPAPQFYMLFGNVDLFDPAADIGPLVEAIGRLGVDFNLIVIDTLARAMAGGDENSAKDMGAFVRNVDRLRKATGAHAMLVHHSGKDASKGARGSGALRAATDTEIEVTDGRITATKQRDIDKSWTSTFSLRVVELGRDEDGDLITSCTVQLGAETEASADADDGVIEVQEVRELSNFVALLQAIYAEPQATQRRLAELAEISKTTVVRLLGRLKVDRLVVQTLDRWELTPKGLRYLQNTTESLVHPLDQNDSAGPPFGPRTRPRTRTANKQAKAA